MEAAIASIAFCMVFLTMRFMFWMDLRRDYRIGLKHDRCGYISEYSWKFDPVCVKCGTESPVTSKVSFRTSFLGRYIICSSEKE